MKYANAYFLILGCIITSSSVSMEWLLFTPTRWMCIPFEQLEQFQTDVIVEGLDVERDKHSFIQEHKKYFERLQRDDLNFEKCTAWQIRALCYKKRLKRNNSIDNKHD